MRQVAHRFVRLGLVGAVGIIFLAYGVSFVWPKYTWDMRVSSPEGKYDLVVLRGDKIGFDDFSYRLYVFPRSVTPHDRPKDTRVILASLWRSDKYLVFDGCDYPAFRWVKDDKLEIDLNEVNYSPFSFFPIKRFNASSKPVLISIVFESDDDRNAYP